jgi:hypothetical protein
VHGYSGGPVIRVRLVIEGVGSRELVEVVSMLRCGAIVRHSQRPVRLGMLLGSVLLGLCNPTSVGNVAICHVDC